MLNVIKNRLVNIVGTYTSINSMVNALKTLIEDITKYQSEDETASDLHKIFKIIQRYSVMYKVESEKYLTIPQEKLDDRSYQVQEILCILTLITTSINDILRKYNMSEDKGQLGKHLRTLTNNYEFYRNEKISWTTIMKGVSTLITARTVSEKAKLQELLLDVKYATKEKENA